MNQNLTDTTQTLRIAFVQSRWHADIVDQCRLAFNNRVIERTGGTASVEVFDVPGVLEIPLITRRLAKTRRYDVVVASGFVVNGGIYRHEFVADAVIAGMMQVQLETDVPILSAVLTPQTFHETEEHRKFFLEHFKIKGVEVADACFAIMECSGKLDGLDSVA